MRYRPSAPEVALDTARVFAGIVYETVRVSVPTVWQGALGQLTPNACDQRLMSWSRRLVERADLELDIRGRQHVVESRAFVIMSNHQSHFDIPVLYQSIGVPMRMVVKKELFRIPLWASAMRAAGFIEVDRARGHDAFQSLATLGRKLLESGRSLWLAPEGTRSPNGELLPFKRGGFRLAQAFQLPILPVTLDGTRLVHAKGSWAIHRGLKVRVTIHAPIDVAAVFEPGTTPEGEEELTQLMELTRKIIVRPLSAV